MHLTNIFAIAFPAITIELPIASTSTCLRVWDENSIYFGNCRIHFTLISGLENFSLKSS